MSESKESVDVTVIVVTYNSSGLIGDFCSTLAPALTGVSYKVVVVDNCSSDQTVELARRDPRIDEVLQPKWNLGYAAGINSGVAANPHSRSYLVLNPDVRLDADCARQLIAVATGDVGIVVPKLRDEHGALMYSLRRRPSLGRAFGEAMLGTRSQRFPSMSEIVQDPTDYEHPTRADWAIGGAMLISAECWRAVGPWDESFFLYEEEVDFCLRAYDSGYVLTLQPDATAVRIVGTSPPSDFVWALNRVNKLRLYARRHSKIATALFWMALVLGQGLRVLTGASRYRRAMASLVFPFHLLDEVIRKVQARSSSTHENL